MSLTRQQRRYLERQQTKAARKRGGPILPPQEPPPAGFLTRTKVLAAIAASVGTIAGSAYLFWPSMEVLAQPWDTFTDASNARFQFKNAGRVAIRNVRYDCLINTPTNRGVRVTGSTSVRPLVGKKSQIIGDLAPGQFVSRDCFGGIPSDIGGHPLNIKVEASFVWPLIGYQEEVPGYFVSETDGKRFWMTPEPEPKS